MRKSGNPLTFAAPLSERELLILHGRRDAEVPIDLSRRFHGRAGGRLVELDADHAYAGSLAEVAEEFLSFMI